MNLKITLTTQEKFMNMAKLGTVLHARNYFQWLGKPRQQRDCGMTRYTLCVFQDRTRRNSSRNGFAFYIPAISGHSPRCTPSVESTGSYVIPVLYPPQRNPSKTRADKGLQRSSFCTPAKNCSTFENGKTPSKPYRHWLAGGFSQISKLFHLCPFCLRRLP